MAHGTVNTASFILRDAPVLDNSNSGTVTQGMAVEIITANDDRTWLLVSGNGNVGWMQAQFVTVDGAAGGPAAAGTGSGTGAPVGAGAGAGTRAGTGTAAGTGSGTGAGTGTGAGSSAGSPSAILRGDGSFTFTAEVSGDDIVVRNVKATWFGGADDPEDNGETASGISTRANP